MSPETPDSRKTEAAEQDIGKAAEYYQLHTGAVDDLLGANEQNSPPVSRAEIRKYTAARRGPRVAEWVKLLLVKWWFSAAVCFFFLWGLGVFLPNVLDQLVVTGLALGFVTDLLTNNALRFLAKEKRGADRWMMVTLRGFWSLPLNLLYAGVIMTMVYMTYNAINGWLIAAGGYPADSVPLGVEPILFGLLCLGFDLGLIGLKHGFRRILRDAQTTARAGRR